MNTTKSVITFADINDDLLNLVFSKGLAFTMDDFNSRFGKSFERIKSLKESKENCTSEDFDRMCKENQYMIEEAWISTLNSILEEYNIETMILGPNYMRAIVFMKTIDLLDFILSLPKMSRLLDLLDLYVIASKGKGAIPIKVIKMSLLLSIFLVHVAFVNTAFNEDLFNEDLFNEEGNDREGKEERVKELTKEMVEVLFNIPNFLMEHVHSHFQSITK